MGRKRRRRWKIEREESSREYFYQIHSNLLWPKSRFPYTYWSIGAMESVVPSSFPSNLSAECGSTRESESLGGRRARLQLQQIRRPSNHYQRRHRKSWRWDQNWRDFANAKSRIQRSGNNESLESPSFSSQVKYSTRCSLQSFAYLHNDQNGWRTKSGWCLTAFAHIWM